MYSGPSTGTSPSAGLGQGAALRRCQTPTTSSTGSRGFRRRRCNSSGGATRTPGRPTRQLSRQGVPVGPTKTAVCSQCHGDHKILPASNPQSTVSRQNSSLHGQMSSGRQPELRHFRTHVDRRTALFVAYLDLLDRLVPAHHRGFTFTAVHTSLYSHRGAKDGLDSREHRHRDKQRHPYRGPALQRVPPLDHFLVIVSFTCWCSPVSAQVQGHALGQMVHRLVRRSTAGVSTTAWRQSSPSRTGPGDGLHGRPGGPRSGQEPPRPSSMMFNGKDCRT